MDVIITYHPRSPQGSVVPSLVSHAITDHLVCNDLYMNIYNLWYMSRLQAQIIQARGTLIAAGNVTVACVQIIIENNGFSANNS